MRLSKKIFLLGTLPLIISMGYSNETDSKLVEKNSTSTNKKTALIDELKPIVKKNSSSVVYSINDKNYEIDSLPSEYPKSKGLKRKNFLDLYLRYELTLNSLKKEQNLYKKEIDAKIKSELEKIAYRGINQNPLDKIVFIKKLTLERIALEEVSKKEENLTQKIQEVYDKNKDKFKYPNTIELSFIVLKDKKKAEKILSDLNKTKITIQDFAKLASKNSIDKVSRFNDGYAGYMTKDTAGEKIFNRVWKSSLGLVNEVLEEKGRYILIYTHKKMKADIKKFSSVKDEIREKILLSKRNGWIKNKYHKVMKKIKVKIYDNFEDNRTF